MAANKPGKEAILAAFFDDGTYSPLFTDGAVSAAYGCANGQNAYVVFEDGSPVGVQDIEKNIRVLEMAAEVAEPVFFLKGIIRMTRAETGSDIGVIPGSLVRVPDDHGDRCSRSLSLEDTGEDLDLIALFSLGRKAALARFSAV